MKLERRAFLGGLFAAAALPAVGADDPSVFPKRGAFERLQLAYQHVHIGLAKPFSVLHISDTHLTAAYPDEPEVKQKLKAIRTQTFGGRQEEALRDSLGWARKNVDYVIHTGDLIDWQSRANFDLVKKYFGENRGFMTGSMGNHEFSPSMWLEPHQEKNATKKAARELLGRSYPFDTSLQSTVVDGVNFVTLDDVYGTVEADQVERFHAEAKKGLPIVLCMHVPFYSDHIWRATRKFWSPGRKFTAAAVPASSGDYLAQTKDSVTQDFLKYLKSEKQLKAILSGHLHITVQDRFSPTAMQYVVGGNFQFHGQEILFT